ncbi:MAG: diphosphomevalonate/mevalonate 3,5-bisphosphate decarboxylase family protein [Candidatus Hodarchaeota archaeon]
MSFYIPNSLINQLSQDYDEVRQVLVKKGYRFDDLPTQIRGKNEIGEAFTIAYPIQGVLKYHGLTDPINKIAYFPSISLNNNCLFTVSYLNFSEDLKEDRAYLNGKQLFGSELNRVKVALDYIRNYSSIKTNAVLISRNFSNLEESNEIGKGLGTSASGSAALALAAFSILYNNDPYYLNNQRLISIASRYLSGSGCRSASGGFSLWLSHPEIDPLQSFAIRLDRKEHQSFINNISLLTIPIKSEITTSHAHSLAPKSLFFQSWLKKRKELIFEFIDALDYKDLNKIGGLAEYDTLCLHAVTMTASSNQNIIAWNPDTLKVMLKIRELRDNGYCVYFSIDTGPSVVVITKQNEKKEIYNAIKTIIPQYNILDGNIGGPCKLLSPNSPEAKKLEKDINKFKT